MTAVRFNPPYEKFLTIVNQTDECDPVKVKAAIDLDLPRLNILPTSEGNAEALKARFNKPDEIKSYSQGGMDAGGCSNYYRETLSDELKLALGKGSQELNFAYIDATQALRGFSLIYLKEYPETWMVTTTAHFDKDSKSRTVDFFSSKHFFDEMKSEYQSTMSLGKVQAYLVASLHSKEVIGKLGNDLFTEKGEINPSCIERLMLSTTLGPDRMDMLGVNLGRIFYGNIEEQKAALDALAITHISETRRNLLQAHVKILVPKLIALMNNPCLLEPAKNKARFLLSKMHEPLIFSINKYIEDRERQGPGFFNKAEKLSAARKLEIIVSTGKIEAVTFTAGEVRALTEPRSNLKELNEKAFVFLPTLKQLENSFSP